MEKNRLLLQIVTPTDSPAHISCDSVHLTVCDNEKGKGGGSYGIRPGHINTLFALEEGTVEAFLAGDRVFLADCGDGFATVKENVITVVVGSLMCTDDY